MHLRPALLLTLFCCAAALRAQTMIELAGPEPSDAIVKLRAEHPAYASRVAEAYALLDTRPASLALQIARASIEKGKEYIATESEVDERTRNRIRAMGHRLVEEFTWRIEALRE